MPFIWNDETYFERLKKNKKSEYIFFLFFVIYLIGWYLFKGEDLKLKSIAIIALMSSLLTLSLVQLFLKSRLPSIPDTYSKIGKHSMRFFFVVVNSLGLYWLLNFYNVFH